MSHETDSSDSWQSVFDDLVTLIVTSPPPPPRLTGDWTRKEQAEAHAVAVAWGWVIRLKRTAQAVLELEKAGYASEASPLVRSVVEHAIRLPWAADMGRQEFVEILLRMRRKALKTTLNAADAGWALNEDQISQIRDLQEEAGDEFIGKDHLMHVAHLVAKDPEQFAGLYQVWLSETQETHPSLQSSAAYRSLSEDGLTWDLRTIPQPQKHRHDVLMPSMLWIGLRGYARIAGLEEQLKDGLSRLGSRMEALGISSQ